MRKLHSVDDLMEDLRQQRQAREGGGDLASGMAATATRKAAAAAERDGALRKGRFTSQSAPAGVEYVRDVDADLKDGRRTSMEIFFGTEEPNAVNDLIQQTDLAKTVSDPLVRFRLQRLHDFNDTCMMLSAVRGVPVPELDFFQRGKHLLGKRCPLAKAAMDTAEAGGGLEWFPETWSGTLATIIAAETRLRNLFKPLQLPRNNFVVPKLTAWPSAFLLPETVDDEGAGTKILTTKPTTGNVTITCPKIGARIPFSREADEDLIVAMGPMARDGLGIAVARGDEEAIISGDLAGAQDSDAGGATDVRKAYRGLRKHGLQAAFKVDFAGAVTAAKLRDMRKKLGEYGISTDGLVYVCGPQVAMGFLALGSELKTSVNSGLGAEILKGQIGWFDGIPVVVSPVFREDLNASGVYDGTVTSKGSVVLAHRTYFWSAGLRAPGFKMYESTLYDQLHVLVTQRMGFVTPFETAAIASVGYNITL